MLPVGMQVIGKKWDDIGVLKAAKASFEAGGGVSVPARSDASITCLWRVGEQGANILLLIAASGLKRSSHCRFPGLLSS